jgi:hypothetical protein
MMFGKLMADVEDGKGVTSGRIKLLIRVACTDVPVVAS